MFGTYVKLPWNGKLQANRNYNGQTFTICNCVISKKNFYILYKDINEIQYLLKYSTSKCTLFPPSKYREKVDEGFRNMCKMHEIESINQVCITV